MYCSLSLRTSSFARSDRVNKDSLSDSCVSQRASLTALRYTSTLRLVGSIGQSYIGVMKPSFASHWMSSSSFVTPPEKNWRMCGRRSVTYTTTSSS